MRSPSNIKLIPYKALLRAIIVYVCPTWEYATDARLLKLQCLQIRVLRAVGKLDMCKPAHELQVVIKISCVYNYITELAMTGTWY
jgi:hypothetical protein